MKAMGSVFKKSVTKPLPEGAEVFTKGGERYARWKSRGRTRTVPLTTGRDGAHRIVLEVGKYYARYRNHDGQVVERPTGCRDKSAAEQLLARWERDAERVRAGILTPAEEEMTRHQARPLVEHFDAFDEHLRAKGTSAIYREYTRTYLDRLAEECQFTRLSDLKRGPLERWLAARAKENMSAKARNHYRGALVTFCNWCVSTGRLPSNPFAAIPKANVKADR